jgi:hypothetical protein
MPPATALVLLLAVPAAPPDAPDRTLTEAVRELAGQSLDTVARDLEFLGEARAFWVLAPGELSHRIAAAGRCARDAGVQLEKVAALKGLPKDDAAALARLQKVAGTLKKQAEQLQVYWDTGVADYGKESDKLGESARKELDAALDAGKKSSVAPAPREPGKKPR